VSEAIPKTLKQFIPEEACLKCLGCCRYAKIDSVWSPCLLDEEVQDFLERKIPPALIDAKRRILPVHLPGKDNFICTFLDAKENKCEIYAFRPFECQLYPFLLNLRNKKVFLTVDLHCPYIKEKLKSQELKDYIAYLSAFLNSPEQLRILRDNPQIIQAYEEVLEVVELEVLPDAPKLS